MEATSERPERLANLLTLSHEPMFAWRLQGSIEFWNAGAERLYGFAPGEAVGRVSHSLLQTKFPIEFTARHYKKAGEPRPSELFSSGASKPNSKPFSTNLAFSRASWTCKAALPAAGFARHPERAPV
jgi:hypothetical protein